MAESSSESRKTAISEFNANYTQSEGRAVGGVLTFTSDEIRFQPNKLDELTGGKEFTISIANVDKVEKVEKGSGSLKDTVFGGGLRDRLRIELTDGTEELFVVNNLDEKIEDLNTILDIESDDRGIYCTFCGTELTPETKFCPECGTEKGTSSQNFQTENDSQSGWISKGLAYFFGGAGLLLGILYLVSGSLLIGGLLTLSGIIGFPITRTKVEEILQVKIGKWVATVLFLVFWLSGSALIGP